MKREPRISPRSQHRVLGYLAVLHSALVVALIAAWSTPSGWFIGLWVAVATLWFFWPLVLFLHVGRSLRRAAVPLLVAGVIAILWWRPYSWEAPAYLGLPRICDMSPISMTRFFVAYVRGRAEAKKDVRDGRLAVEVFGFGIMTSESGAGLNFSDEEAQRYQIEIRRVADCFVDDRTMGHVEGYNTVSMREIDRRLGRNAREEK